VTIDHRDTIERVVRHEGSRIVATLIRRTGSFDRAEDAFQEALAAAVAHWPTSGLPANPAAWVMAVAQRKAIDAVRRERIREDAAPELAYEFSRAVPDVEEASEAFAACPDDRLRLFFTCCHPALNLEARIALTLRVVGRLSMAEIARAFLVPETTLAQRLTRAKHKIQEARIPYEVPARDRLHERLDSVLAVVYLIFNEGYAATAGEQLVREDLAAEAVAIGRLLAELLPDEPEVRGLLALMLLHHARRRARISSRGELVPLEDQDRRLWDETHIAEGVRCLECAVMAKRPGPYQLQAAIAATHVQARTAEDTDWTEIAALYGQLVRLTPTPVVALNHAVAVAMSQGLEAGLDRIDRLGAVTPLDGYRLFHAARADLLRRLGRRESARAAYERAFALTTNRVERAYIRRRLEER
jgi:RNA polymerase sigma-70 factor (ECF subfamily)